ncbi:hypothetical protein C2G38_2117854 [Gigaspora rosea]|uniref:Attractin/MKLN-like beta-propeller domain-containing protein n=1 Tax=Gigaspora rosea TaxID=44941 RepID=A0A397U7G6_9GLOM|nr:hypothetical protein C2G38_2117854 [Gigaspora rosea]
MSSYKIFFNMNFFQNFQSFLLIIILLFSFVNCQNIPNPRYAQTSSLIGKRLYFFGGDFTTNANVSIATNEVWYLDLSSSFNTATPPWNKDVGMPIGYKLGTSCVSPIDNSVFLVGGRMYIPNTGNINLGSSPVHVFNSNISLWTTPNIINGYNSSFEKRNQIQPVIDNNGKVYIFGGTNFTGLDSSSFFYYNDMSILDTTSMTWSTLAAFTNAPPPLLTNTATLLPTGIIVYIGGFKNLNGSFMPWPVSMNEIQTFNTKNFVWSAQVAGGASIGSRIAHSAVLTQNGEIIIYGGSIWDDRTISATPYIAKLDTSSWMWSIPDLSLNSPQLCYHSAALYGDYMIIAFGQIPSKSSSSYYALSNNLYILDIKSYTWVTSFNPNQSKALPPTTIQTPSPDNNLKNYLFIGIGIGAGMVLLGVFSVVGFLLYKRKRQNQYPKSIPTPGNTDRI